MNLSGFSILNIKDTDYRCIISLCEKFPNKEFFSGQYFPVFRLNTEIYGVNLRIQSKYRKIRTRKSSVLGHFSCNVSEISKSKAINSMKNIDLTERSVSLANINFIIIYKNG